MGTADPAGGEVAISKAATVRVSIHNWVHSGADHPVVFSVDGTGTGDFTCAFSSGMKANHSCTFNLKTDSGDCLQGSPHKEGAESDFELQIDVGGPSDSDWHKNMIQNTSLKICNFGPGHSLEPCPWISILSRWSHHGSASTQIQKWSHAHGFPFSVDGAATARHRLKLKIGPMPMDFHSQSMELPRLGID